MGVFWTCVQGRVRGRAGDWICAVCECVLRKEICTLPKGLHQHCPWPPQAVHVILITSWECGKQSRQELLGALRAYWYCIACKVCLQHELDPQKVFLHCWLACKIAVCWQKCHISPCTAGLRVETRWKHRSGRAGICTAQLCEVLFFMDQILMALTEHQSRGAFLYSHLQFYAPSAFAGHPFPIFCLLPHSIWDDVGLLVILPWVDPPVAPWWAALQAGEIQSHFLSLFLFACSPALAGWTWTSSARSCSTTAMWTRMGKFRNLN